MASAAEQLAASMNFGALSKATPTTATAKKSVAPAATDTPGA